VPRAQRVVEHLLRGVGVRGDHARDLQVRRDGLEPRGALLERRVEQVLALDVEDVEEERHDPLGRRLAVDARHGLLERGRPVLVHPERLAVEDGLGDREAAHRVDDPGQRVGDLVEVARVDADLVAAAMDLDPDAVELPLDR
jgi:hypothetical protein